MSKKIMGILLVFILVTSLAICNYSVAETASQLADTQYYSEIIDQQSETTFNQAHVLPEDYFWGLPEYDVAEVNKILLLEGFIPKGMRLQGDVTASELLTLLTTAIQMRVGSITPEWQAYAKNKSDDTVWRSDAALALYYAAQAMGISEPNAGDGDITDSQSIEFRSRLFSDWEGEVPVTDGIDTWNFPKLLYAQFFCCCHQDTQTGRKLMETDEKGRFNFTSNMTKVDAIEAAYRLYMSLEKDVAPEYVTLDQVGLNTIPKELLEKKSSLPDVSNQHIPAYKGYYIQNKESAIFISRIAYSRNFQEEELRFLSENGFNFEKVHLGFTTLSYPDFPEGMVNLNELRELDQLIAWGIEYDVHICIAMSNMPGISADEIKRVQEIPENNPRYIEACRVENPEGYFNNIKNQKLMLQYWQMLAKRYANVPTKFLSFQLAVEPSVSSDKQYRVFFGPIVDAIWAQNADRVIFSYAYSGDIALASLAKKGCALTWSTYCPAVFNMYGAVGVEIIHVKYPYLPTPIWPMLYLPATLNGNKSKTSSLIINGEFNEGSVGIYTDQEFMGKMNRTVLSIFADEKKILSQKIKGTESTEVIASIPKGTKRITIKVNQGGWLQYGRVQIKQAGKNDINLYPHDMGSNDFKSDMPILNVHDNGIVTTSDPSHVVDFNYIYKTDIKKIADLAKKYHVGYMMVEWGPFGNISEESRLAYEEMMLSGFSDNEIGWCHHSLVDRNSILLTKRSFMENLFAGDSSEGKYIPLAYSNYYYTNMNLLNLYRKYTMK